MDKVVGGKSESLRVIFANVQSIVKKMDEVRAVVSIEKPDIVIFTETWANENIGDSFFLIPGYEMVAREDRNDTEKGRGGGILVFATKNVKTCRINVETSFNQYVTMRVKCQNEDVMIHAIYRSPNSRKENDDELCKWVERMNGTNIIIGDLNFPDIDWETGTSGSRGRNFFEATTGRFMEQHVQEPTHLSGNVLDLILCDQEGIISSVKTLGRIGKSDHETVSFEIIVDGKEEEEGRESWNFRKARFKEMRETMGLMDWRKELEGKEANTMWIFIRGYLKCLMERFIPKRKMNRKAEPKWMNAEIHQCILKKRKAWKRWKETGREVDKAEYKKREGEVKRKVRQSKNRTEREIMKYRKSDPKLFYSYVNRSKLVRNRIGPLLTPDNKLIVDPKQQAQILNGYFGSVFTRSSSQLPTTTPRDPDAQTIKDIWVSEGCVEKAIDQLNENSASGPDEIPSRVIKELKQQLLKPLTILFTESLKSGKIPEEWRLAEVVPIFKKGRRSEPGNYRPVSLTVTVGKLLERIVKDQIVNHLETNNLISNSQHGFRSGRSPQTNLIEYLNTTTKWLDEGKSFDVLYLDFAKAFDVVSHGRLVLKLRMFGIEGRLLKWLEDWLAGRKQRVRVEGKYSDWEDVLSSVVQGSVLGGTLFDIFIDDIDVAAFLAWIWKFADDSKVAKLIANDKDGQEMQSIINNLAQWAAKWEMRFNVGKCKVLHMGNKNPRNEYFLNGLKLESAEEEKDLGVWIGSSLKPTKQCATAAKAANFAMGQLLRSFHYRKKANLIPLYKTFVRPRLEFAASAWSPWNEGDIQTLEKVQERFIKQIPDVRGRTYEERLDSAGLTTLRARRQRGDAIETFKTLGGFNRVDRHAWFQIADENSRATRSTSSVSDIGDEEKKTNILKMESVRLDIRKNFFTVRVVKEWNGLPEKLRQQTSVNSFKNAYDSWKQIQRKRDEENTRRNDR